MLDALVRVFHELGTTHPRGSLPLLVRAAGPPDEADALELEVLPLDGQHPGGALLGHAAPERCVALGVVTTGWSLPPGRAGGDTANRRTGPPAAEACDRVAVFSTVVVDRSGGVAGRFSLDGGPAVDGAPESGVLLDLLLRAMGCPTAPAQVGVLELLASAWLADLAVAADPSWSWREVAGSHWALRLSPGRGADELVQAAADLADALGWTGLRRVVARTGWPGACTGQEAAWFDDGAFARWLLGTYPPLDDLCPAATAALRPTVARRVRGALRSWRLPA
jgi:hypothetical protein